MINRQNDTTVYSQNALCFRGLSFLFAWNALSSFGTPPPSIEDQFIRLTLFALCAVAHQPLSRLLSNGPFLFIIGGLSFFDTIILCCPSAINADWIDVSALGAISKNILMVIITIAWCNAFGKTPFKMTGICVGQSFLGAFLLYLISLTLPEESHFGIALLLVPISLYLCYECHSTLETTSRKPLETEDPTASTINPWQHNRQLHRCRQPKTALPYLWHLALIYIAGGFTLGLNMPHTNTFVGLASMGVAGAVLVTIFSIALKGTNVYAAISALVSAMAIGYIVSIPFGMLNNPAFDTLISICSALSTSVLFIYLGDKQYRFGIPAILSFSIIRILSTLASIAGMQCGSWMKSSFIANTAESNLIYLVACALSIASLISWLRSDDFQRQSSPSKKNDAASSETSPLSSINYAAIQSTSTRAEENRSDLYRSIISENCEKVANEYGLSKREREVLGYLALGWTVKRIETELVISNSTVKSHVNHIYRKLGIHTRNELLILVGIS